MLDNPGLSLSGIARGLDELSAPVSASLRLCLLHLFKLASPQTTKFATALARRQYCGHVDLQSSKLCYSITKGIDVQVYSSQRILL